MPLSIRLLRAHPGFREVSVERGVGVEAIGLQSSFVAMCHYVFDSVQDFMDAYGPHAATLQGDLANYTDITPTIQIGEVLISQNSRGE
jgi:uncharacterized protein (TIGR02118 family)